MHRREAIAISGLVLFTGCTDTSPESDSSGNTNTTTDESENTTTENDPSKNLQSSVKINNVSAPNSVEQNNQLEVITEINSTTDTTVTTSLITQNGTEITSTSDTIDANDTSISLQLSIPADAQPGNSTLQVSARGDGASDQVTTNLSVAEFIPEWKQLYKDSVAKTEAFLTTFADVGTTTSNPTILSTSISSGYSLNGRQQLEEAGDLAWEAFDESANTQTRRLRSEINMLEQLTSTQSAVCDLMGDLRTFLDVVSGAGPFFDDELTDQLETARDNQKTLSDDVSDLNPIVGENYGLKVEQLNSEINAVENMLDPSEDLHSAQKSFRDEDYDAAANQASVAESGFDIIINRVNSEDSYPPTDDVDNEFVSLIQDFKLEAIDLESRAVSQQADS